MYLSKSPITFENSVDRDVKIYIQKYMHIPKYHET